MTRKRPLSVLPRLLTLALTDAPSWRRFPSLNAKSPGTPSIERLLARSIRISVSPLTENPAPVPAVNSAGRAAVYAIASCDARASEPYLSAGGASSMSRERVPRSYTWKSKDADAAAEGVGDSGRDMFFRIAVYKGRCGCPSGMSSGTGPDLGPGDGLPKRMLRAVLGPGDPGGEVIVVVEVFGRGEDAGDVKLAVSRRQLDTLEVDRRRR